MAPPPGVRPRFRRQAAAVGTNNNNNGGVGNVVKEDIALIANSTGMATWQVILLLFLVIVLVVGLIGWCVWRFFRKKRRAKEEKGVKVKKTSRLCNDISVTFCVNLCDFSGGEGRPRGRERPCGERGGEG